MTDTYPWPVTDQGTIYVLRNSRPDGTCHHNGQFQWPEAGPVEAPDWDPRAQCGGGLHGLAWGTGDYRLDTDDVLWQVVEVAVTDVVDLGDKVKFRRGTVIHSGADMAVAAAVVADHPLAAALQVAHATRTAGDRGTATAGDRGTATAGYSGTATAGDRGTATAGDRGTATAGYSGTATAGNWGVLSIAQWDGDTYRRHIATVGENGIKPNVAYQLNDAGLFIPAKDTK